MVCRKCGAEVTEQARVCPRCGAPCVQEKMAEQPAVRRSTVVLIVSLLALFCAGIAALYYVVLRDLGSGLTAVPLPDAAIAAEDDEPAEEALETVSLTPDGGQSAAKPEETEEQPEVVLTLSETELRLQPGEQAGLLASVQAPSGQAVYVFWSSSDDQVATVDSAGMVTALAEGECVLTASSGGSSAACRVIVDAAAGDTGYLLPSDTVVLTAADLNGMTQEEVMLARNEIFARHGRVFRTASIQAYFESCAWYVPDPSFDENAPDALDVIEQANLRLLIEYETEHGWR